MLINTVILLLRDALPIILLFALLLLNTGKYIQLSAFLRPSTNGGYINFFNKFPNLICWSVALLISLITTGLLVNNLAGISQQLDGKGIEILISIVLFMIYLMIIFILFLLHQSMIKKNQSLAIFLSVIVIIVLVFTLNATNFITYLVGFWLQTELQFSLVIGIILGMGICISVGILFYFSLLLTQNKYQQTFIEILFLLFGCGQLIQALNLLLQVDLLPSYASLWDTSFIINEDSELGHFFTALMGYEATPSLLHLSIYISAFIIPVAVHYFNSNNSEVRYDLGESR